MNDVLSKAKDGISALEGLLKDVIAGFRPEITRDGRLSADAMDIHQYGAHSLAWMATYVEALRQLTRWAGYLESEGRFGEIEQLILRMAFGEYTAQIFGGIPMAQGEFARLNNLVQDTDYRARHLTGSLAEFEKSGNDGPSRSRLIELMLDRMGSASFGDTGLDDETEAVRSQLRRFTDEKVVPFAHAWHVEDSLIPVELVSDLAELGVFGLTVHEEHGGSGMSKTVMCAVSEELSRGYLGVGSLATRSEIAAELVACGGTEEQKAAWLPGIASGSIIPTAVFTEPGAGSDLGSLLTRAEPTESGYRITGNKTWITHAGRADLMTLLARTDPGTRDHSGLSMFVLEKTPGTVGNPFPDAAITGSEIPVIGYRGMKEYEIGFDGYHAKPDSLLGGSEGMGFRQLMQTFESARIQTAARAVGVAQSALECGLAHAVSRTQFGRSIAMFPRIGGKLAMMAVEIMLCRQLTYFAASRKDEGRRCDLEAGMAKLLAARVAWTAADNSVQIHGGNGFAVECPASRILCDARILSIFEGAAEIQAHVIARRILQPQIG